MTKIKVLFVCIHNSARSQMAESYLNFFGGDYVIAQSGGLEPGTLNPVVIKAMMEDGIDISQNKTKSVQSFLDSKSEFDYVITVCDETSAERCPVFPGQVKRLHWGFPDPSAFEGNESQKLEKTKEVRDQIKKKVEKWIETLKSASSKPS